MNVDQSTNSKNVLILGAGYVSAPVVDYLTRDGDIDVTVGKRTFFCRTFSLINLLKNIDQLFPLVTDCSGLIVESKIHIMMIIIY